VLAPRWGHDVVGPTERLAGSKPVTESPPGGAFV
jgi:hypothetical protein